MINKIGTVLKGLLFLLSISVCSWSIACVADEVKKDLVSKDSGDGRCKDVDYKEFHQIVDNPEKWTKADFDGAYALTSCTDGGDLEDFIRAIGVFMEKNPELVFQKLHDNQEPDFFIGKLVRMLPLELADDWQGKLERSKLRLSIIEKTDMPCCTHERDVALQALAEKIKSAEKDIVEVKKIQTEIDSADKAKK